MLRANPRAGSIDAILFLPLLTVLLSGTFAVAMIVRARITLERRTWDAGFESKPGAVTLARCGKELHGWARATALPRSMRLALLTRCGRSLRRSNHAGIRAFAFPTQRIDLESRVERPGADFRGGALLQRALWQEFMHDAGFGSLPLELLGLPELAQALGVLNMGVPR